MIVRVWEQAVKANAGEVVVACGDPEIKEAIEAEGGHAVMTDPALPSGSDRVFAGAEAFDPEEKYDVLINLQGDQPTFNPTILQHVLEPLSDESVDIATPVHPSYKEETGTNPAIVKAILSFKNERIARALYFTRATAPHGEGPLYHHIGVYAFRRSALKSFVNLSSSPLELREKLEQLRALEHNMHIATVNVDSEPLSVDTAKQLEDARRDYANKNL
jgi:3-deoxy-manno-octulosonate cytidylyltransferase (CMP-KDO synthetase)